MPRRVDLAHAALAQLVQHHVVADDQAARLALVDGLHLKPGQSFAAEKFLRELLAVSGTPIRGQAGQERVQLGLIHHTALGQYLRQLVHRYVR